MFTERRIVAQTLFSGSLKRIIACPSISGCLKSQLFISPHNHHAPHPRHIAEQMDSRLLLLRRQPQTILLHGADHDTSRRLLAQRYPQAAFSEYDHRPQWLAQAAQARRAQSGWLGKISGKGQIPQTQLSPTFRLPENSAEMLWSNLMLHHANNIGDTLANWSQALHDNGLLFFSHLGDQSLPEIRHLLRQHNIPYSAPTLVDMHDLGDALLEHQFYDPIVDTISLTLTYQSPSALLQDIAELGIWQALRPSNEAAAQEIVQQAWQQGSLKTLTLEIIQGHALRKTLLPENTHLVQFHPRSKS